jgi:hypothetical protein
MKKKIIIISVVLIGFFLAVTANSWAQRERGGDRRVDRGDRDRGGQFQKLDKPAVHKFNRNSGQAYHPGRNPHHYRPEQRFKPEFHKRHHYRAPHRFGPKYRFRRHWPAYRHAPNKRFFRRHRHSVINQITNYYSSAESYAEPQDEFQASATVSDSGFSVSVGVSKTN